MRLKRRLTLVFALLAVLPLATAGITLTRNGYTTAYEATISEQRQDARRVAVEVQTHVTGLLQQLLLVVRVKGLDGLAPESQRRLLSELQAWQNQFADLAWLDAYGNELAHVNRHEVHALTGLGSRADRQEFQAPRASGAPWVGPMEIDPQTAEPLMVVAVPSQDARLGSVTGVLVARIRLKRMWEAVARTNVGNDDHLLYIADPSGLVVAHPNPSVVLRGIHAALPVVDGINTGLDGSRVVSVRVPLVAGSREFTVVAEESLLSAMSLPFETAVTIVLVVAASLMAAMAAAVLASRTIVGPIQRLAAVAGHISGGDLTRRAADEARPDEIGELARAFNRMTARLADSVSTLEASVSERTRDLTTAQARLVEAIESISEGFVLCDENDDVVLTNQKFRDFYPEVAHLAQPGKSFYEVFGTAARLGLANDINGDPDGWMERRTQLRVNQSPHVQHLNSGRWMLISERRTNSGQMVAIYTDITELKAGEDDLRAATARAESAAQAKGDFLAAMSHELRTPLNAIIGFSDTILSGVFGNLDNDRYRDYMQDIHRSGLHLLSLINDILDLSKIEAGHMSVDCHPVALESVVQRAVAMMRDSATASGLSLNIHLPPDLPDVAGDDRRLLQVMLNLLSNAVKFTPEGGLVQVNAAADGDMVILRVEDTGIGIAAADIPQALETFGQIDSARSRRFPGSGLGLPLSRRLVEILGGSLGISSTPGAGTTVTIRLPAARQAAPPQLIDAAG